MRQPAYLPVLLALCVAGLAGCSPGAKSVPPAAHAAAGEALQQMRQFPASVSPARVAVKPMDASRGSASAMQTTVTSSSIDMLGWTQLPGGAVGVAASPDGSLWALSTLSGDYGRLIYHYQNGSWTNIPGSAVALAAAPDNSLWAVNSLGGIYHWNGSSWNGIAGGASDVSVGSDGSVYVISNQGGGPYGYGIWHYVNGAWTQLPGAGVRIAASWDTAAYPGSIGPGGFYVTNAQQGIYYYDPSAGYQQLPGSAFQVSPTRSGGLFALGVPPGYYGEPIYYRDLSAGSWTQQPGAATSISTDGTSVYVTNSQGGIFKSPVTVHNTAGNGAPLTGPNLSPGTNGGWGPTAVANALSFPVQQGFNGSGVTVAVVIDSGVSSSDLSQYLTYFQTPSTGRTVSFRSVDGASTAPSSDPFEAALDVETIAGIAPGANVTVYVISSLSDQHIIDAYNAVLADGQASVVSSSFGGCEFPGSAQNAMSSVFQQGANNGVAFVASSGDQGNECFAGYDDTQQPIYQVGVNNPASDPNVVGVGGNETHRPESALTNPVAWNDTVSTAGQLATGGGVSASFGLPAYQNGIAGLASASNRNVPDVAMPGESVGIYVKGAWARLLGTSWSAPLYAGLLAEVYQYCSARFPNPVAVPYTVFKANPSAFIDVTSGNNQFQGTTPFYTAHAGYDATTGVGVPLGMTFAQTLCPNRVPSAAARRPMTLRADLATRGPAEAVAVDVVPHVQALADRGARAASATTRVQLVLRPTASAASDEQAVIGVLRAAGFTIVQTFGNHLVVDAEAPSAAVEGLFATRLHDVQQGNAVRYMPVAAATIPASLAPYVAGLNLDDVVKKRHI
jgi:Tectonin domain/Subtilase family